MPATIHPIDPDHLSPRVTARYDHLSRWATDNPAMQRRFRQQLRESTGWSDAEVEAAIVEYLRFCAIAAENGGRATPSPAVDSVWHLHLTWTRDYWLDFCPRRLGLDLHHQPSTGHAGESERLRDDYADTVHAYAAAFGPPPERWWPRRQVAPTPVPRHRGSRGRVAMAIALLLPKPVVAGLIAGTPLDWAGPEFLALFCVLFAAATMLSMAWRAWLLRSLPAGTGIGQPDTWELAYLAGGPERVVDSAVAELHRLDTVVWEAQTRRFLPGAKPAPDDPLLEAVRAQLIGGAPDVTRASRSSALARIRSQLQRRTWWCAEADGRRIALLSALPFLALTLFGASKVVVGLLRDRPVAILVFLCVAAMIAALVCSLKRPGITPRGKKVLREARSHHALTVRTHRREQVAMAVALGGTAVLSGTALAGYHAFRHPPRHRATAAVPAATAVRMAARAAAAGAAAVAVIEAANRPTRNAGRRQAAMPG